MATEPRVTRYSFEPPPERSHEEITVEARGRPGEDSWAIMCRGMALNANGRWDFEMQPSSRTEAYLRCHRFPLELALRLASEAFEAESERYVR